MNHLSMFACECTVRSCIFIPTRALDCPNLQHHSRCKRAATTVTALRVTANETPIALQETLATLNLGAPGSELSERNKRTIGILRQLFPTLTQVSHEFHAYIYFTIFER